MLITLVLWCLSAPDSIQQYDLSIVYLLPVSYNIWFRKSLEFSFPLKKNIMDKTLHALR